MNESQCDVAIIGGGPVGAALALALQGNGLQVVLLEARESEVNTTDPRALALSYGTRLLLQRLGAWEALRDVSAIKVIEVTQKNSTGLTTLRAQEMGVEEMGYVLPYTLLHGALQKGLANSDVKCIYGARVSELRHTHDAAVIEYQHQGQSHTLTARLAVAADGGKVLEVAHPPQITDYGQSGVIAHVLTAQASTGKAFEHFTPQGPMALLPYLDGYELVLTATHDAAQDMLTWDDAQFLAYLHNHFGNRVGDFLSIGKRSCYPLRLKRAPDITFSHTALIGNAAQTLHPVAGQGFNMGIRDAWELAQVILDSAPENIGSAAMCAAYRQSRRLDRNAGIRFTDGLVRLFSNDAPLLGRLRSAALTVLDTLPLARKFVAKRMMFGANG
ncbi:MAG: ubiquinone biosynthesis protein UbiH [Sideroxydans sp.]|nr:ubiquinone biosynthesis protein UbiH [Sideroxydans sp.]